MAYQIFDTVEAAQLAEKLAVIIPPYAFFEVTAMVKNEALGVPITLTLLEARAAAEFLIRYGYAIPRLDFENKYVITLTERGRKIGETGSIPNLLALEKREERQRLNRERTIHLGYWLAPWIAFATFFQGAADLLEIVRNYYNPLLPYLVGYILPYAFLATAILLLWLTLLQPLLKRNRKQDD